MFFLPRRFGKREFEKARTALAAVRDARDVCETYAPPRRAARARDLAHACEILERALFNHT